MPLLGTFLRMSLPDDFDGFDGPESEIPPVKKPAVAPVNVLADIEFALSIGLATMLKDERKKMLDKHRADIERARWSAIVGVE